MSKVAALLQQAATTMAIEQKRETERATRRRFELGEYLARKMVTDPALRERVAVDMNSECTRASTRALFDLDEEATWFDMLDAADQSSVSAQAQRPKKKSPSDLPAAASTPPKPPVVGTVNSSAAAPVAGPNARTASPPVAASSSKPAAVASTEAVRAS